MVKLRSLTDAITAGYQVYDWTVTGYCPAKNRLQLDACDRRPELIL